MKGTVKGLFNLGRAGAAKAVKSDIVKQKIKETANHYLDRALDSFTSDLSRRLDPVSGSGIKKKVNRSDEIEKMIIKAIKNKLMKKYKIPASNWKYIEEQIKKQLKKQRSKTKGGAIDIHKMIGKIPKPKAGWTPRKYKYMGPYNPLENQLEYDKNTGEVTKWHVQPHNLMK